MPRRLAVLLLALAGTLPLFGQDSVPPVKVHYVLDASGAKSGAASVEMTVQNNPEDELTVAIPAWRPGSYRLQNYHQRVRDVTAAAGGATLEVESVDKQTWRVKAARKREVAIRYKLSPDRTSIAADHYFIEGPGTYFYVVGHKEAACTVRFKVPGSMWCASCKTMVEKPADHPKEHELSPWKVGSGLTDMGDGIYGARDYDTFADCPTELGPFEDHSFTVDGATYELVVHASGSWDSKGLIPALKKIVREQCRVFGRAPFERYVFLFHFREGFGGAGLEHLNSTDISMPYLIMRRDGAAAASLCSHEFFHTWNVKRIRPRELGPFDYTGPVRSKALWLCEGGTSYYGDLTLARARIWSEARYFQHLGDEISTLQNNPLRKTVTVEESSQTHWDRRPGQPFLDYYNKGELLTWLFDLRIRALTDNEKSFDDVMRYLYRTYVTGPAKEGKGSIGVGHPEDGILKAINTVSGHDFGEFYAKYVSGLEELPYKEIAEAAGLKVDMAVDTAAELASNLRGAVVQNVPAGSGDEKAGLKPGDRLIEIGGKKVTGPQVRPEIGRLKAGQAVAVKVSRGSETVDLKLTPVAHERARATVTRSPGAAEKQRRLIDSWLRKESY